MRKKEFDIRTIAAIGMMAAIICVATMTIRIPTLGSIGYIHPGDSMVFVAAIIFGRKNGVIASAIGMGMADIIAGYMTYAPFTIVIKAVMAFIVATIAFAKSADGKNVKRNIAAFTAGGVWMVAGYYVTAIIMLTYITQAYPTLQVGMVFALESIPGNIAQFVVGALIAVPVVKLLDGRINFR